MARQRMRSQTFGNLRRHLQTAEPNGKPPQHTHKHTNTQAHKNSGQRAPAATAERGLAGASPRLPFPGPWA
eukprot:9496103-Pyramimonas_sp.AAC.1